MRLINRDATGELKNCINQVFGMTALRYNLCCGPSPRKEWINVDREKFGQEIVADLNKEWTWAKPHSAEHILIEDGLEHLDSLPHFLRNAARLLKEGGMLEINVPHFKNPSAYRFTHAHFFSYSMFQIFPEAHDETQNLRVERIRLTVDPRFPLSLLNIPANLFPNLWERLAYVSGIRVWFRKKGE